MRLFYNAFHPLEILDSLTIKTSQSCGRDRGVSMSSQIVNSHGPFTFVFRADLPWYDQFAEVQYGECNEFGQFDFLHKVEHFRDEYEWWSRDPVHFQLDDVEALLFRRDSAGVRIFPRKAKKIARELALKYPQLFTTSLEVTV